jgi:cysteine desulfuration protein SufE
MNINNIQDQIIKEFSGLDDWLDKYEHLIKLGKSLKISDMDLKKEEYQIPGCQSNLWINVEKRNNKLFIAADSDALITRGIISLLLRVLNNQSPDDIVNADLYFIDKIGLSSHLSPTRANGLALIVKTIKSLAQNG